MSFYNNRNGNATPGPGVINGSPSAGLRNRVAVCVERVLDSCIKQETGESMKLQLSGFSPPEPKHPFKFLNAHSTQVAAFITDLSIIRVEERPEFARIKCRVNIPMAVLFEDSAGVKCTAESRLIVAEDVLMYVPKNSIFPFEIKAVASVNCTEGKIVGENTAVVTACYTIITKVTADTDLFIPTYGYCQIPRAVDFSKEECSEFFDLPLYPSGK